MMSLAVKVHLPGFDEWQMIVRDKALACPDIPLAFPNVVTVQYGRVLIASQKASRPCVRIIASDQRTRQNNEEEKSQWFVRNPSEGLKE